MVAFDQNFIHGEHGILIRDNVSYINASSVDEQYNVAFEPIVIDIDGDNYGIVE